MSPVERLYAIVEQGYCTGCGLCQSVAGKDRVRVVKTTTGHERPVVVGDIDDAVVDAIYDVCPGIRVEGMPADLASDARRVDNVWGPMRRIVRGWASDPAVRFEGSTGGVLTALAGYLISSGRVEFVLHAKASKSEPTFGERHISFSEADVLEGAGSRYGPTAPLTDIKDVLDRNLPFAFIGKPCDIAGLRNYGRHDPRVGQLVKYWLTPVCGGYMPPDSTNAFLRREGIEPAEVTGFRYRGRGCPGPVRIETRDGAREAHYVDFWGEDESQWTLPFRCKICPDGIGESADIAAADTWLWGTPDREASRTDPGTNAILVRTKAGSELLDAAVRDGVLTLDYDIPPDEMTSYNMHQMRKKYAVWPRIQGLADEGRILPKFEGVRIRELSSELSAETNDYQRAGARARVRNGRASEPTPAPARRRD